MNKFIYPHLPIMKNDFKKFQNLSHQQIAELKLIAFDKNAIRKITLVELGKRFISDVVGINIANESFDNLKNNYKDCLNNPNESILFNNEEDFYRYIAEEHLILLEETVGSYIQYLSLAKSDLEKINHQIEFINTEIKNIEDLKKNNGWLDAEKRYYKKLLEHYREKNISASNEIFYFLSEKIEIYNLSSYENKRRNIFRGFDVVSTFFVGSMPYSYSRGLVFKDHDIYDVKNITEMSNKFMEFPAPTHKEIKKLYDENQKDFFLLSDQYIRDGLSDIKSIIEKIKIFTEENHIVAKRKDILLEIFEHYKNKHFISVVYMLPMQIEGIFHDICVEVGVKESALDISSLNEKLRKIQENFKYFIYFEYYSFLFPIIRNSVAHGKIINDNYEETAIMLMLDLLPVCELASSEKIPINGKKILLDKAINNDFKALVEYLNLMDIDIPEFYQLSDKFKVIEEKYKSVEFWNYLRNEVKKQKTENINQTEIMRFIRKLHGKKLCKEQSDLFFKEIHNLIEEIKKAEFESNKLSEIILKKLNLE